MEGSIYFAELPPQAGVHEASHHAAEGVRLAVAGLLGQGQLLPGPSRARRAQGVETAAGEERLEGPPGAHDLDVVLRAGRGDPAGVPLAAGTGGELEPGGREIVGLDAARRGAAGLDPLARQDLEDGLHRRDGTENEAREG